MTPEQFIDLLEKLIGKQLQKKMFHLGKIASIDGDRASVYIDGSTIPTPNVPYNPNIKFNAGEEVWVVFINFDPNDKFILCKRGTEPPDPPPSGEGQMQMHGNEWEELGDAGYGDMLKSIYDQNNNGIVDNAEKLGGKLPSYYEQVYHTGTTPPTNTNLLWIDTGA